MIARLEGIIARAAGLVSPRRALPRRPALGLRAVDPALPRRHPVDRRRSERVRPPAAGAVRLHPQPSAGGAAHRTDGRARALAVLLAVGILTLPVSILMTAAMITAAGVSYSFSKVDHFILFELVPLFLVFAGWGASVVRRRVVAFPPIASGAGDARDAVLLYAMTIGWAMLSAAVPKVMAAGWTRRVRRRGGTSPGHRHQREARTLGSGSCPSTWDLFWKLLDYATIAAEGLLIVFVLTPISTGAGSCCWRASTPACISPWGSPSSTTRSCTRCSSPRW